MLMKNYCYNFFLGGGGGLDNYYIYSITLLTSKYNFTIHTT